MGTPEGLMLGMAATCGVWSSDGLFCERYVLGESPRNVIPTDDHERRSVPRSHDAESTCIQIKG